MLGRKKSMKYTRGCMELASFVVGFDIVELWTRDPNGNYHCTYVHAAEAGMSSAQSPMDRVAQTHHISPKVCLMENQPRLSFGISRRIS